MDRQSLAERFLSHEFSSGSDEDWDSSMGDIPSSEDESEIEKATSRAAKEVERMAAANRLVNVSDNDEEEEASVASRLKKR